MPASRRALGCLGSVAVLVLLACGGGGGSSERELLLSSLSVAVPPGGTARVTVVAEQDGDEGPYAVSTSDEGCATVSVTASTATVTGVAVGRCTVRIENAGAGTTVPVEVYDPFVIDTGELLIAYTTQFELLKHDPFRPVSFYRPVPQADGFYAFGPLVNLDSQPISGRAAMVVKAKNASAMTLTTSYQFMGSYSVASGNGVGYWRPVCPAGYKALGTAIDQNYDSGQPTPCIREDLTATGVSTRQLEGFNWARWYAVDLPDTGPAAGAHLTPGTFITAMWYDAPEPATVLKVRLPAVGDAPARTYLPKLTSLLCPDDGVASPPHFAKAVLIPFTSVSDPLHDEAWRATHSPFYRLERHVYFVQKFCTTNLTTTEQTHSVDFTAGITTTDTETFSTKTGIEISAEAGVEVMDIFSAKVTTTLSQEFGYESQSSVSELEQEDYHLSLNTPPDTAAALWQQVNVYMLYRHAGAALELVNEPPWEFGMHSYVTGQYPR